MQIPTDSEGRPTVSVTQLRRYGADDLRMDDGEDVRGCPRAYLHTYCVPKEQRAPEITTEAQMVGTALHRALALTETENLGPEDALGRVWPAMLGPDAWADALQTLHRYLDRAADVSTLGNLAVELDLRTELYVDDDFGPVMLRGIIDRVDIDLTEDDLLWVTDLKSGKRPPSVDAARRDSQLKAYDLLVRANAPNLWRIERPRVACRLDAMRYRDIVVRHTAEELEEWREWAAAVSRTILRDEEAAPVLNEGCSWCRVRFDCPAWTALPDVADTVLARQAGQDPEALYAELERLEATGKRIEARAKEVRAALEEIAFRHGGLEVGGSVWRPDTKWEKEVDLPCLHAVLGDAAFYDAVRTSETAVKRVTERLPASQRAEALACIRNVPAGDRIARSKALARRESE
jgi:RecB family exonuclease